MRIIFASTPVGPLGSGIGGGVELTLRTLADELVRRGHVVEIVAPRGSRVPGHNVHEVAGALHVPSQTLSQSFGFGRFNQNNWLGIIRYGN